MSKIYVNNIQEQDGITHGYAVINMTVAENMSMMYSREENIKIATAITNTPNGEGYFFDRFCQFVIFFQFNRLGLSMQVSDFHNDTAAAFEYYMQLMDKGWNEADRKKVMKIFNDIDDNKKGIAEMIIKDEFPLT